MLTRFNDVYDFEKEFSAIVAQDVYYDGYDTEVKVFIPALMPNIMHGTVGTCIMNRPYSRLFANKSGTEPKISSNKITEKNYLVAKVDPNSNLESISDIFKSTIVKEYSSHFQISTSIFYDPSYADIPENRYTDISYSYSTSPDGLDEYEETENNREDLIINNSNDELGNNSTEVYEDTGIIFSTDNNENIFIITDNENNELYNSSVISEDSRIEFTNKNDEIVFKSNTTKSGMYYEEAVDDTSYVIKEGSLIRCQFLNSKASKLYLKSGPKK